MSQASGVGSLPPNAQSGFVKQVLSGDAVVVRGQPKGGPPPERTLALSNVTAPKLARRANVQNNIPESKDEPFAWDSREYLRKLLVGREVKFATEYRSNTGREYGALWINEGGQVQNVTELAVGEGWVEVRQSGARQSEELTKLLQLQEGAKAAKKGKWNKERESKAVREVVWNVSNLGMFVERLHGKEVNAVIEFVRDGSTFRAILLPSFEVVMVAISGIKCPAVNRDDEKDSPEHALEARYCLESRLLQRDVKLLFEGVSNQQLVLATVIHPAGNIAELLLKGGYAKCVDWSMAVVTTGKEKLRSAERYAKEKKLRLWKDYQPSSVSNVPIKCKAFSGKVVEVVNGDALVVKAPDAGFQKIFLSSLRSPKPKENGGSGSTDTSSHSSSQRVRPLYDVPYMFEAREFLRKKLVGKKVNVTVDYIKPAQDAFPERTFCTVTRDGINIAEALISKGFGTCLKHRQDDDQRSSVYDDLMASEAKAKKNGKGLHSQKDTPSHRVADVSGDLAKSKQFLPFLQRAGKTVAIVEFVASGSRARLYLPKDTCLITFLLAGVSCPRAPRIADGPGMAAEPFGEEALLFTKELILQREVEVEVEACDKRGNFIGWMYVDGKNLSLSLVEEGLSKVSPQADRSSHGNVLYAAEEKARAARKKLWEDYVEKEEEEQEGEESKEEEAEPSKPAERKTNYQEVIVTEVLSCNRFYSQFVDQGPKLDQLMDQLRSEFTLHPPLPGSFTPRKGMLCAALFSDQMWYRAMIERVSPKKDAEVLYIDFGNRETVPLSKLAALPSSYTGLQAQAKEFYLACVASPPDEDWSKEAFTVFRDQVLNAPMKVNVEYKSQGQEYVTLVDCEDDSDVGESLIHEGLVRVERRKDRRVTSLIERYIKAEEEARKARKSMWCYGDITPDDAKEFGYQK